MRIALAIFLFGFFQSAMADGYIFKDGHFPEGKATVLTLTQRQKNLLDIYYHCRNNEYTPYIFRLTKTQSSVLAREAGLSPKRFAIFESYRGDSGTDIEFNVINRFSEGQFEIPHKLLDSESNVRNWETKTIGWAPSPLARVSLANLKSGKCPK